MANNMNAVDRHTGMQCFDSCIQSPRGSPMPTSAPCGASLTAAAAAAAWAVAGMKGLPAGAAMASLLLVKNPGGSASKDP